MALKALNKNKNLVQIFKTNNLLDAFRADKVGDEFGIQVSYSYDGDNPLGTGGALKKAIHLLDDNFYINGEAGEVKNLKVIIPNIKYAIITGSILTFAHTMGEFGVNLMIGGKIPGVTKVASLAIYSDWEALNYEAAHFYSLILLGISILIIFSVNLLK